MTPNVPLSSETVARLQAHAVPLVDTFDTVINRAVDALDAMNGNGAGSPPPGAVRSVNPSKPPNLAYTTVHSIIFKGKALPPAETYWNNLLLAVIREAKANFTKERISDLLVCNHVLGPKEDNGYKYLDDVGISVQGQDANHAWKATYHLLSAIKLPVEVAFSWQDNPKAAAPGEHAKLVVDWK
jgi:hypothetical protein